MSGSITRSRHWTRWPVCILLPTLATISLFGAVIFAIVLPTIEQSILDRKEEMIRRLTESAWSVLAHYRALEVAGDLSRAEAQARAIEHVRDMHYGAEMKDYFWINDMHPRMVMHPYRPDLEGQDLSEFRDPRGKRLFQAFVDVVRADGGGYVDYIWQWKDDESRVVPKLSYARGFEPWGWVIGTGVYYEDVRAEVAALTRELLAWCSGILGIVLIMSLLIVTQSMYSERRRQQAEQALRESEGKYRQLYENSFDGIASCDMGGRYVDCNPAYEQMVGYTVSELRERTSRDLTPAEWHDRESRLIAETLMTRGYSGLYEKEYRRKDGSRVPVELSSYLIGDDAGAPRAMWTIARDITARKHAESEDRARSGRLHAQQAAIIRLATESVVVAGDFEQAARAITEAVSTTIGVERVSIWLLNDGRRSLRCVDLFELSEGAHSSGLELDVEQHPAYFNAIFSARVVDAHEARSDPRTCELGGSYLAAHGITSMLDSAVRVSGQTVGVVCHEHVGPARVWRPDEITFAGEVADQVAQALINADRRRAEDELKRRVAEVSEAKRRLEVLVSNITGREKRMVELKQEVNELLKAMGREARYRAPADTDALCRLSPEGPTV